MRGEGDGYRPEHRAAIETIMHDMNGSPDNPYILKGGTALMLCYGLSRFSEDIDLDAQRATVPAARFFRFIEHTCREHGYDWREGKNTPTVQRAFVNYGREDTPLKIEVSHRIKVVDPDAIAHVGGIKTYTISELCELKASAYQNRDKIRDLYDLTFIIEHHYDELSKSARKAAQRALEYKDVEQFDYLTRTQHDPLIDVDRLADGFLNALDMVGLTTNNPMGAEEPDDDNEIDDLMGRFSGNYDTGGNTSGRIR